MVDALQRAREWLRPAGFLIDIRPTPEPGYLEVQLPGRTEVAGRVRDVDGQAGPSARHARADTALATALDRHWFAVELRREFSFYRHGDTLDELRDHIRGDWRGAAIDDAALGRAAALLASERGARVRVREQVGLARLTSREASGVSRQSSVITY